jgi:uncharacterized SAM-binding protein YcdF (DUF218 family)
MLFTALKKHLIFLTVITFLQLLVGCRPYYNMFYTDPVGCFANACKNKPYDVIIVPGFPSDSGKLNQVLEERIGWAYYLYKNNFTNNIIFSGSAVYTPYVEAKVMRLYALQIGIKSEHIFVEEKAEHTTENLYYGYQLALANGFKKIAFATQPAQTSFMKPFRRKFKLNIDMLPQVNDSLKKYPLHFTPVRADEAFENNFISIEKRETLFKRMRGTRGYKVKQEIKRTKKQNKRV